jgi:hypothetical protein
MTLAQIERTMLINHLAKCNEVAAVTEWVNGLSDADVRFYVNDSDLHQWDD